MGKYCWVTARLLAMFFLVVTRHMHLIFLHQIRAIDGHYDLISKYNAGLRTILSEGLSEPEFYGDLVYKYKNFIRRIEKGTSRQRSGKGAIRKRFPLQKPRWGKTN